MNTKCAIDVLHSGGMDVQSKALSEEMLFFNLAIFFKKTLTVRSPPVPASVAESGPLFLGLEPVAGTNGAVEDLQRKLFQ